jgi:lanthanide-dependent methanol dehydrogenase
LIAAEKVHPFVNWATSVDLKTGVPSKSIYANTHQDYTAKGVCPTFKGAKGMAPAAYSPKTKLIYIPLSHSCMTYHANESLYVKGQPWKGAMTTFFMGPDGVMGGLTAFNPTMNKNIWYNKVKFDVSSGLLVTATNLVFYGTLDRWFKVVDTETGKELWQARVGSGVVGNVFSYNRKGRQYIGVISGLGGLSAKEMEFTYDAVGCCGEGAPQLPKYNATPSGGAINIFSL